MNRELSLCTERKTDLIAELEKLSNQFAVLQSMLTRQDELLKRCILSLTFINIKLSIDFFILQHF